MADKYFPKEKPLIRNKAKYRALMRLKNQFKDVYQRFYLQELTPLLQELEGESD